MKTPLPTNSTRGIAIMALALVFLTFNVIARNMEDFTMPDIPAEIVPGEYHLNISWDGGNARRTVLLIIPDSYDSSGSHPLIHVFHGSHGNADAFRARRPNLVAEANRKGMILAFPQGSPNRTGNGFLWESGVEDNKYLTKLTAGLIKGLAVDPTRIVLTGFSGGAGFAQRLGGSRADLFAGVVAFCGTTGITLEDPETGEDVHYGQDPPREPIPVVLIRGGLDELIPPHGENRNGDRFDTVGQQFEFWIEGNGCDAEDVEISTPAEGVTVRRGGTDSRGTLVVSIFGDLLGHRWPDSRHPSNIDGDKLVIGFVSSLPSLNPSKISGIDVLPDSWVQIHLSGESGHVYTLDGSSSLKEWEGVPVRESQDDELPESEIIGTGAQQTVFVQSEATLFYFRIRSHGPPLKFGDALFE